MKGRSRRGRVCQWLKQTKQDSCPIYSALLSVTAEGTYWLLTFPEEATGKGAVSPTMLCAAAVSVRSRLRRERERGRVSSEATTSHGLYK